MSKKVDAEWRTSLDVTCPHCEHDFDLERYPDSFEWIYPITTKQDIDYEIECPNCKEEFIIENIIR